MDFKFILFFALLFLMLCPQGSAQEVSYNIEITLSPDSAHEVVKISLNNTGDVSLADFSYEIPQDSSKIRVYDGEGDLFPEIFNGTRIIVNSRFRRSVDPGEQEQITIEFESKELISKTQSEYLFSALFTPPPDLTKSFVLKVGLPKGMGLPHPLYSTSQTDIAPLPDRTFSDGTRTIFEWDVKQSGEFALFIRYLGFEKSQSKTLRYGLIILAGILLIYLFVLFRKKRASSDDTEFMREDEKIIIDLIRENEGIIQRRLGDFTGFSKAKVSKIVSELEKRSILMVEKIGRRKKLFLTDEFKKNK
jgi:uncharacterized membrane protein